MPPRKPASTTVPLGSALEGSEPLARLMARLRQSRSCFEAVKAALPPALATQVQAGGYDEGEWTLLAGNGAVAAKLRQLQPRLEEVLREHGHAGVALRIRVRPPVR
jgi:hypothetical protein